MAEDQPIPAAERWLPIPGYEGIYSISDFGRVRREAGYHCRVTRLLKQSPRNRYLRVELHRLGHHPWTEKVSRLVLLAFVGPAPDGMQCLHGDGNCFNDRLDNLRWGTSGENHADMIRHGTSARGDKNGTRLHPECLARGDRNGARLHPETVPRGSRNGMAKINEAKVVEIHKRLAAGESRKSISRLLGLSKKIVADIASGKTWCHVKPQPYI